MAKANMYARWMGLSPVVATQVPYSLTGRAPEREIMPFAKEDDIAVTAWGMINGGVLTGKYRDADVTKRYDGASDQALAMGDAVVALAKEIGRTPAQVAINWVRQQQGKAQVIPILGARTVAQLQDNLGVLDFELTPEQIQNIEAIAPFEIGFPRSFLLGEHVLNLIHGKTAGLLDNHRK